MICKASRQDSRRPHEYFLRFKVSARPENVSASKNEQSTKRLKYIGKVNRLIWLEGTFYYVILFLTSSIKPNNIFIFKLSETSLVN